MQNFVQENEKFLQRLSQHNSKMATVDTRAHEFWEHKGIPVYRGKFGGEHLHLRKTRGPWKLILGSSLPQGWPGEVAPVIRPPGNCVRGSGLAPIPAGKGLLLPVLKGRSWRQQRAGTPPQPPEGSQISGGQANSQSTGSRGTKVMTTRLMPSLLPKSTVRTHYFRHRETSDFLILFYFKIVFVYLTDRNPK